MTLTSLLSTASGKMAAIFKHNPSDKSATSLLKGLQFECDSFGYEIKGDTVHLFDTSKPDSSRFALDSSHISSIKAKQKKDKYGALSAKLFVGEDVYHLQFA